MGAPRSLPVPGCPFTPRCAFVRPGLCASVRPPVEVRDGRRRACHAPPEEVDPPGQPPEAAAAEALSHHPAVTEGHP